MRKSLKSLTVRNTEHSYQTTYTRYRLISAHSSQYKLQFWAFYCTESLLRVNNSMLTAQSGFKLLKNDICRLDFEWLLVIGGWWQLIWVKLKEASCFLLKQKKKKPVYLRHETVWESLITNQTIYLSFKT